MKSIKIPEKMIKSPTHTYLKLVASMMIALIVLIPFSFAISMNGISLSPNPQDEKVSKKQEKLSLMQNGDTTTTTSSTSSTTTSTTSSTSTTTSTTLEEGATATTLEETTTTTLPEEPGQLTLSANVPELTDKDMIDINVSSLPNTRIELRVNNAELRRGITGDEGSFTFSFVNLNQQSNIINITAFGATNNLTQAYQVMVDLVNPELALHTIPALLSERTLNVSGTVNKPVTIAFNVIQGDLDASPPNAPADFRAQASSANSIELSWSQNSEPDFLQYIIYRQDIGVIATATPAGYTAYEDILVDSGKSYKYQISALDKSCRESIKSPAVSVLTPQGGEADRSVLAHGTQVICSPEGQAAAQSIEAERDFNIQLSLEEGINTIIVTATDSIGRSVRKTLRTEVDSEELSLEITSPVTGTSIYDRYANSVTIKGKTKPYARVELGVKKQPIVTIPAESTDFVSYEVTIGEIKRTTTANKFGEFTFENVDLTTYFEGELGFQETRVGEEGISGRYQDLSSYKEAVLVFRATDSRGKQKAIDVRYSIGSCWSGKFAWGIGTLNQYQSPALLSVERLSEGTEEISFYLQFTYLGIADISEEAASSAARKGKGTRINSVSVRSACDEYIRQRPSYDWACRAMSSSCRTTVNPTGDMAYVTCRLTRLKDVSELVGNDLKDWFDAIDSQMIFPLMITISYQEDLSTSPTALYDIGQEASLPAEATQIVSSAGYMRSDSQTSCEEVVYVVDNGLIDARKVLPDWLLYDGVRLMDTAIDNIQKINDMIKQVMRYVTLGCMAAFVSKFGLQVYRRITCSYDNAFARIERIAQVGGDSSADDAQAVECKKCLEPYEPIKEFQGITDKVTGMKGILEFNIQDMVPDECLEKCYPKCAHAWDLESKNYQIYRLSCDRIFCHTAPSRWTETKTDNELFEKAKTAKTCENDQNIRGQPLTAVRCGDLKEYQSEQIKALPEDKCFEVYGKDPNTQRNIKHIFSLGSPIGDNLYHLERQTQFTGFETAYALKVSDRYYMTAQRETCNEICGIKTAEEAKKEEMYASPGQSGSSFNENKTARCWTVSECISYGSSKEELTLGDGKKIKVESAYNYGFTSDCFYGAHPSLASTTVVSKNPDLRRECCCINSEPSKESIMYYSPNDLYIQKDTSGLLSFGTKKAEESEGEEGTSGSETTAVEPGAGRPASYSEMKWSYRYWKTNFMGKRYNPDRYIKGRDFPACFGQNNWIFDGFGKKGNTGEGNLLTVDPFKQHTSAFQCLCLSGIYNRLRMIQNLLVLLSTCLKEVRETGKGDAGVCKEVFTQYVCGMIWDIISYLQNGCVPLFGKIGEGDQESQITSAIKVGTKSTFDSLTDSVGEISSEYGNAELNTLLGTGEGSIARAVCLAAFGFDWELSLENVLDAAYSTPFATLVQPITKTREYLSFDPRTGSPKYEYSSSWIINPGCDLDYYDVSLACVSDDDIRKNPEINCAKVGGSGGAAISGCDCSRKSGTGPEISFFRGRTLTQNKLENKEHSEIIRQRYRFDHLKFTLVPSRRIIEYSPQSVASCFPSGHEDGVFYFPIKDSTPSQVLSCSLDVDSGISYCGSGELLWDREGRAYFVGVKLNGQDINLPDLWVRKGDDIAINADIFNSGRNKCFKATLSPYAQGYTTRTAEVDFTGVQGIPLNIIGGADVTTSTGFFSHQDYVSCSLKPGNEGRTCDGILGSKTKNINIGTFETVASDYSVVYIVTFNDTSGNGTIDLSSSSADTIRIKTEIIGDIRGSTVSDFDGTISQRWDNGLLIREDPSVRFKVTKDIPFSPELSNITIKLTSGRLTGSPAQETWKITYGIYYLEEGAEECSGIMEDSPVSDGQSILEFTKTFSVREEAAGSAGSEQAPPTGTVRSCSGDLELGEVDQCDCDEDGVIDGSPESDDCVGVKVYCINKKCYVKKEEAPSPAVEPETTSSFTPGPSSEGFKWILRGPGLQPQNIIINYDQVRDVKTIIGVVKNADKSLLVQYEDYGGVIRNKRIEVNQYSVAP